MNTSKPEIATEFWLSLATSPLILGLMGAKAIANWLYDASAASEEVFRGDRLPVLHFPDQTSEGVGNDE